MVTHVVMWTVRHKDGKSREEVAGQLKETIESMRGRVPHFESLEVGVNRAASDAACDAVLITRHSDWGQLNAYRDDPVHREVAAFVADHTDSRAVVDFES